MSTTTTTFVTRSGLTSRGLAAQIRHAMAYNPRLGLGPSGGASSSVAGRVFVLAADTLAADALRTALSAEPRITLVPRAHDADVVIWDLGADTNAGLTLLRAHAGQGVAADKPLVALVTDAASAACALQHGALGAVDRASSANALAAAVLAVRAGLCVLDARVAESYVAIPEPQSMLDTPDALTVREREVLQLLAAGLSNKAIADQLHVSVHTVKFHVNAILDKLDVDSRTAAVATALRRGLVTI